MGEVLYTLPLYKVGPLHLNGSSTLEFYDSFLSVQFMQSSSHLPPSGWHTFFSKDLQSQAGIVVPGLWVDTQILRTKVILDILSNDRMPVGIAVNYLNRNSFDYFYYISQFWTVFWGSKKSRNPWCRTNITAIQKHEAIPSSCYVINCGCRPPGNLFRNEKQFLPKNQYLFPSFTWKNLKSAARIWWRESFDLILT